MSPTDATLALSRELIRRPSVTPDDAGCQALLSARLTPLGFACETLQLEEVTNLWARWGEAAPLFVFAGHTDVVPTGPVEDWQHPPFEAVVEGGWLHGRGAADMKGALAAFVTALERFAARHPAPKGSIGLLITSDEEGPARHGTRAVMDIFDARGLRIDRCLVGEPSSTARLGDVIKNGRRGSLGGRLTVEGIQGHVAYAHLADNPIHALAPALAELVAMRWDEGNASFPPTSFQVSNIQAGTGATNVIPGRCVVDFNLRFSTELDVAAIQARIGELIARHGLKGEVDWAFSGPPFLTEAGALVEAAQAAVLEVTGAAAELSTSGGTSDGRFIAPRGAELVELGLINATIHKVDERVRVEDLGLLSRIYEALLERLCA